MYANFSGAIWFANVAVHYSSAQRCGGISIHGNSLALVTVRIGSTLSFVATSSESFGGSMCLFLANGATFASILTPTNVAMISAIDCSAETNVREHSREILFQVLIKCIGNNLC